jgi:hypothetical protein
MQLLVFAETPEAAVSLGIPICDSIHYSVLWRAPPKQQQLHFIYVYNDRTGELC